MTPSTSCRPRGHIPLQQRPGSYSPVAHGRCSCEAPTVSAAMQTTLSYRLELSVPMGRGAKRGRGLRKLSGAPGWPKEEGCPVWKTGCPRGTRGCIFPTHLLTQTSPSCPAGPRPPGRLSQPEQEGDRWAQAGLRPQQVLFCFTAIRCPLPCAPDTSQAERAPAPANGGQRGAPGHTQSQVRKVQSPHVLWAPGPAPRPGSTGPVKCWTNSGQAGRRVRAGPLLRPVL